MGDVTFCTCRNRDCTAAIHHWPESDDTFSDREMRMVRALEMIATGKSSVGVQTDIAVCQSIAKGTLKEIGWPA